MTLAELIYQRSLGLPEQAAREALDFIEFLGQRYGSGAEIAAASPEHDAWFQVEVQRALDDPRPGLAEDQVQELLSVKRAELRSRAG